MAIVSKIIKSYLWALLLLVGAFNAFASPGMQTKPQLDIILDKCAEYCDRLSNAVLHFICTEKVSQEVFQGGQIDLHTNLGHPVIISTRSKLEKKEFVYDYQLYYKDNQVSEVRHLLEEDGKEKREEFAELKGLRFEHKNVIMGPVGVLSRKWQLYHDYRILKQEKFKGHDVWVIEAVPKPNQETGHLYGKIWVSRKDFSILRIEWNQHAIKGYEQLIEDCKKNNLEPFFTLISEYTFLKKGIRFPSSYELREEYSYWGNRKNLASKKIVTYDNYKFFTVETKVEYKK